MDKLTKDQYALRANISKKAMENVYRIQGQFAAAGTRLTIEQTVEYILLKTTKK
jgi:hypothetical protein